MSKYPFLYPPMLPMAQFRVVRHRGFPPFLQQATPLITSRGRGLEWTFVWDNVKFL